MNNLKKIKLGYAALSLVLTGMMLAGCSADKKAPTDAAPSASSASKPTSANVKQEIGFAVDHEVETLDPQKATFIATYAVINQTNEGLVRQDSKGKIVEGSAKSWDVAADGLTYTFHLRDANWSDGKPVTAYDFEYAWKRAVEPGHPVSTYSSYFDVIVGATDYSNKKTTADKLGFKALDEKTLQVKLTKPTTYFLDLVTNVVFFPVRKDFLESRNNFGTAPENILYNGPFKLESLSKAGATLVKNEGYWDAKNVKLTKVNIYVSQDDTTRTQMYEDGKIIFTNLHGDAVKVYKDKPNYHLYPNASTLYLVFNPKNYAPFANVNIRKAFALAIDKKGVTDLFNGSFAPAKGFVPSAITVNGQSFRDIVGNMDEPDPKAAKNLLAQGMKELKLTKLPPLKLLDENNEMGLKISEHLKSVITEELGVQVTIESIDLDHLVTKVFGHDYQLADWGWAADYNDAENFLNQFLSASPLNPNGVTDKQYEKMFNEANGIVEPMQRAKKLGEAEKYLVDEKAYIVPLLESNYSVIVRDNLKNFYFRAIGVPIDLKWFYLE